MSEHDFPEGFAGAGPMYAAVPLGEGWLRLAARGAETFVPDARHADTAFLDRDQAVQIADARDGTFLRWEGLSGHNELTPARAGADAAGDRWSWMPKAEPEAS